MAKKRVVVLGASPKPERYSNMAVEQLLDNGHEVLPVNPLGKVIHGQVSYKQLSDISIPIDTITLYVGEKRLMPLAEQIIALKPHRIIMNPGAESDDLESLAQAHHIEVVRGCTLVMLRTQQF